jgi:thioester reductase-like protein
VTTRLFTGATGFVGGAIALELLDRTDDDVYALVRPTGREHPQLRLHTALISMAQGYGRPDLVDAVRSRTRAYAGDITAADGCGVDFRHVPHVDEVWHCAASLQYGEAHRAEIEAHNVGGTQNVLGLARHLGATRLHHVSTAYVAGSRRDRILEEPTANLSMANNCYERSKMEAERIVALAADDMTVRILRPSIVIGHSLTHHGVNWSGMYGFARSLLRFRKLTDRKLGTFLSHVRLRLLAEPDIKGNVIPIDYVARNAVTIGLSASPLSYFHLVNTEAPTVRVGVNVILDLLGLREPLWVNDSEGFTSIDTALNSGMDFYRSYLNNGKNFDSTNTDSICGPQASRVPLTADELRAYFLYFLRDQQGFRAFVDSPARVVHGLAG